MSLGRHDLFVSRPVADPTTARSLTALIVDSLRTHPTHAQPEAASRDAGPAGSTLEARSLAVMSSRPAAFSDELEVWLRADGPKTLGGLGAVFAEKAFAVAVMLLMFVPALPLPTGGISHIFELITIVIAAQMVSGRRSLWLPQRWQTRGLGAISTERAIPLMIRWIRRFDRRTPLRHGPMERFSQASG